ncbi:MAG: flavodoxin domain-containing protein [Candidatus Bathyarchaeota archaeon]|nr:flavodoxin domain-containing protein [Candidatus Bathyarchaeota archaeon]
MARVIVVYESKYGNTKRVAETIVEGMSEVERIEAVLKEPKHVEPTEVLDYDVILIGSPNHIGGPTRGIRKFIDKLGKIGLEGKPGAVFDTYMGGDFNKAVRKMEKRINEKVHGLKLITSGLSIKVGGTKGPIVEGELPKCKDFGKKIASQLET